VLVAVRGVELVVEELVEEEGAVGMGESVVDLTTPVLVGVVV
jgi:hypothetical protein